MLARFSISAFFVLVLVLRRMPVLVLERFTAESSTSTSAGGLSTSTKSTQMLKEPSGDRSDKASDTPARQ